MILLRKNAAHAILLCMLMFSCSLNKSVKLTSTNFTDVIEQQQNLVFAFDRVMAPDSLVGKWDSVAYIAFTPPVKGLFKWNSGKELVFSPSVSFAASTDYVAQFTDAFTERAGGLYPADDLPALRFHTPYLAITAVKASWASSQKSVENIALQLALQFNYRVDPDEIKNLAKITISGTPVTFELKSAAQGHEVIILADGLTEAITQNATVDIRIGKGLKCLESSYVTPGDLAFSESLPSPEKLEITQVQGIFEGNGAIMEVSTNQPVETNDIRSFITIAPSIPFTVEKNESGFVIMGDFNAGASYELSVGKKLKGKLGGSMTDNFIALVPFGQMAPSISFASAKGIYLSSQGSKTVGINIVNIPKIKVTVTRIFENNIQAYMRNNRYNEYDGEDNEYGFSYGDYNLEQLGEVVMKQEYETKNLARTSGVNLLNLDFSQQGQFRGIYLVKASSVDDQWRKAVKLVSVSDIGLIAKHTGDEIHVFANSILDMEPIAGVKVNFTSRNNQVLHTATTNRDGVAVFSGIRQKFPGFSVSMITARNGNDFNYMIFSDTKVEQSRFDVGGSRRNESGYRAFIYGDREIYRPGETIHNNIIIRNDGRETVRHVPVKIKYILPNGRELQVQRKTLNSQGACETKLEVPAGAVTGTYTVEVYTANDLLVGSSNISIEEFIPDRINVVLASGNTGYSINDSIEVDITALNLFGPPAAGRNYEAEFSVSKKYFYSTDFPSYDFNIEGSGKRSFPAKLRQGKTDAQGKAYESFSTDTSYRDEGMLAGKIFVTVFDESGRPVNRVKNFDIRTQTVFFGLRIPDLYTGTQQETKIGCAAADPNGKAIEVQAAHFQVIKVRWHTVMERTYGTHYRYVSQRKEEVLVNKTVKIGKGGAEIPFVPNESGQYLVRLRRTGSDKYVESSFYSYRWGSTSNTSFEVNNEGQIDITMDKEKYSPGDKAQILFKTPFSGKLLVTVERNKVFEYHYLQTDKKAAMLTLPLREEYLPNVYISATLFKPIDDGSMPLTVAHGYSNLEIEKASNKLPVTIYVAEKSGSRTRQKVTVKTLARADIEMTVAVVDEGIMQLKNSPTPDPYGFFYSKEALEVNSSDVYPYVLPDLKMKRSSSGGDGYDLQKRVNPLSNKRVKLVAYWSGILKTNRSGEASCTFDIPQFSGDLRVMAVAYAGKSFGSAEKHIKVADPIVISASIPRFLSPGDTLIMPVTVSNTLASTANVNSRLNVTGPINVTGVSEQTAAIDGQSESRITWKVAAQKDIGEGSIEISVTSGGVSYTDKTDITIRPPASLQKMSDAGSIPGGSTRVLNLDHPFIASSTEARLLLSRSPMAQFTDQLEYLLDYPYGCVEQTTSIAFPQLYYADLVKSIRNKPGRPVNISRNVQAAIGKLQSLQLYNGALSYWPGGEEESWWGSVYACHFLTEAKKAGYEVSQPVLDKLLSYMGMKAKSKAETVYYFTDENGREYRKSLASRDIFYSLYVMAISGKADMATMNLYKYKTPQLSLDSRYMLATTFMLCGDRKSYESLLPKAFEGELAKKETGGSFSSYVRDEALALSGLLEADPDNPQIPVMVNHLSKQIRKEKYLSTQERAFAFLALGKFMNLNRDNNVTASISAGGTHAGNFSGEDLVLNNKIAGKSISVTVAGKGNLYYSYEAEGLTKDGSFRQEDNFLRIRKTFFNRFGQPVTGNTFSQNDLVVVRLTLENTERTTVSNVVITDMLPAGFEIENPRIGAVTELSWIKDQAVADHMDVRDDRIHLFTTSDDKTRNFYYLARAVSTGKFIMGPVSADAMYNGEYHSYHGAGIINVVAK